MNDTHGVQGTPWYGFDLDGTLAEYHGWKGLDHIGAPVQSICAIARRLHAEGKIVKVVTARVAPRLIDGEMQEQFVGQDGVKIPAREFIQKWCAAYLGFTPEITYEKDHLMICLFDDRTVQVEHNTGRIIGKMPEDLEAPKGDAQMKGGPEGEIQ